MDSLRGQIMRRRGRLKLELHARGDYQRAAHIDVRVSAALRRGHLHDALSTLDHAERG